MKKFLLYIALLLTGNALYSQDIHFSQFNRSYLNLNPAQTGAFDGDYRFNGNYRNQWSSVAEPYRTFSFSAEGKSVLASRPQLSAGFLLFNDEAGLGGLRNLQAGITISYSLKISQDSSWSMQGGLFIGVQSRSINFDQFNFDRQYTGRQFDPRLENGEYFDRNSFTGLNSHVGALLRHELEHRKSFSIGIAFFNINGPNQSLQGTNVPLDLRSQIRLGADYKISEKLDLMPSILWAKQGSFQEFIGGANLRYRYKAYRNLYGGVWYRNQDAIIVSAGMDYDNWHAGVSYDINTSELENATNNRGGLELSFTYIIKNYRILNRKYKACPKYF